MAKEPSEGEETERKQKRICFPNVGVGIGNSVPRGLVDRWQAAPGIWSYKGLVIRAVRYKMEALQKRNRN